MLLCTSLKYNIACTISSSASIITLGIPAPVNLQLDKSELSLFNTPSLEFHQQQKVTGRSLKCLTERVGMPLP